MAEKPTPALDTNTWRKLIGPALRIIDSLENRGYGKLDFCLGGGTVLMFRFGHRISKDIDIFTHGAQALSYLSPRLNEEAKREVLDYHEQANVIKLTLTDGSIGFIVAGRATPDIPRDTTVIEGRAVAIDATAEILAKKLLYRADSFKARDVFDMAAALALDRPSAIAALRATASTRPALLARLTKMAEAAPADLLANLVLTEAGQQHAHDVVQKLLAAIHSVDSRNHAQRSVSCKTHLPSRRDCVKI